MLQIDRPTLPPPSPHGSPFVGRQGAATRRPGCAELSAWQRAIKRAFDILVATGVLGASGWIIPILAAAARRETGGSGIFRQERVGRHGRPFTLLKIRTMRVDPAIVTTVTTADDPRIGRFGRALRRTKLDELPQFVNVLVGDMSVVGPRPDVAGFADLLRGADRAVLAVRPGITGPATLCYRDEESLLAEQTDPERYNREVLWPAKVRINRAYVERWRIRDDLRYLLATLGWGKGSHALRRSP